MLDALPKRLQAQARAVLREIWNYASRRDAEAELDRFEAQFGARYPKPVAKLRRDQDALLTFYDYPAEHWKHLRTSKPVESTFATVRLRQRVNQGPSSRKRGLLMAFKLLDMAALRWRRLNGYKLLPLVRAGVEFVDGVQLERHDRKAAA